MPFFAPDQQAGAPWAWELEEGDFQVPGACAHPARRRGVAARDLDQVGNTFQVKFVRYSMSTAHPASPLLALKGHVVLTDFQLLVICQKSSFIPPSSSNLRDPWPEFCVLVPNSGVFHLCKDEQTLNPGMFPWLSCFLAMKRGLVTVLV